MKTINLELKENTYLEEFRYFKSCNFAEIVYTMIYCFEKSATKVLLSLDELFQEENYLILAKSDKSEREG